jgi:hypothetical protein
VLHGLQPIRASPAPDGGLDAADEVLDLALDLIAPAFGLELWIVVYLSRTLAGDSL